LQRSPQTTKIQWPNSRKLEEVQRFLLPLPVGKLYGIGRKTEDRLSKLGIKAIGQLANYDTDSLINHFGKTLGLYYHNAANGIDESPVQERPEAESISRITALKENTRNLNTISEDIYKLSEDIHRHVKKELSFKSITIMAIMKNLVIYSRIKPSKTLRRLGDHKEHRPRALRSLPRK